MQSSHAPTGTTSRPTGQSGAGIVASVAYFLEGSPIAAALVLGTIAAFWMNGPRAFDKP